MKGILQMPGDSQFPGWIAGLVGGIPAAIINLIILAIGEATDAELTMQGTSIEWPMVLLASLLPMTVVGAIAWKLMQSRASAWRILTNVGVAVALLSCISLVTAPDVATAITLGCMHLVAAAAWYLAMTKLDVKGN